MTAINSIGTSSLQTLGLSLQPTKLSEEQIQKMKDLLDSPRTLPSSVKADNDPSYIYGYVKKDGKVVATLYNGGSVEMSNAAYARTKNLPTMTEKESRVGPELAQARAREIADKLGGTIEKAKTAQTQAQWSATKAEQLAYLSADAQATRDAGAKTKVDTQLLSQNEDQVDGAVKEFLDFMSKTPEQRWHEQWLRSKGMTEEEFNALSPEEKQALIDEMTEEMKQKLAEKAREKTETLAA